eukprot:12932411-Prorocentrum_lima.AAC.1
MPPHSQWRPELLSCRAAQPKQQPSSGSRGRYRRQPLPRVNLLAAPPGPGAFLRKCASERGT